jgi:hypothetical protein
MITFTGAVGTAELTRDEVIAMHQDNVDAIRRRITLIQATTPEPAADTAQADVIARLDADIADQLDLIEQARDGSYPYPLATASPAGGTP